MRHVQNIGMPVTLNTGFFFLQKTVFYGPMTTNEPKPGQNAILFAITISLAFVRKVRLGSVFAVSAFLENPCF